MIYYYQIGSRTTNFVIAPSSSKTGLPDLDRPVPTMSLAAVLDAATDDTLLAIAIALPTSIDLLRLVLTCRAAAQRFYFTATSYRSEGSAVPSGASGGTAAATAQEQAETWSIIEEAACQWTNSCTDQEQGWVPRRGRESWVGLMCEVESLHRSSWCGVRSVAGRNAFTVDGHCFYDTEDGSHWPGHQDWEGMQTAMEEGDRIGMLLDLDQGTMTVYKNDERLGVMATGLSGEYCWAVSLFNQGTSTRIEAAPAPASPTAEELARAVAYEQEHAGDDDY